MLSEADEVLKEDLEASSDYYQNILNETSPQIQAANFARENYGVEIDDKTLNSIMQQYVCTLLPLHKCVENGLSKADLI